MSNHICIAQDAIKELGEGWAVDVPRSEKSAGAYITGPDGVCVYLTTRGYGAQRDRIMLSSGASWRNAKGAWCSPYNRKDPSASSDPKLGGKGVAKRIRATLAAFKADCDLARATVGREDDYEAMQRAIGAQLEAGMPHASRAHGDHEGKGVNIAIHAEPDDFLHGHAYASGGTVELELRSLTPEQAIAAVKAVVALCNVRAAE